MDERDLVGKEGATRRKLGGRGGLEVCELVVDFFPGHVDERTIGVGWGLFLEVGRLAFGFASEGRLKEFSLRAVLKHIINFIIEG